MKKKLMAAGLGSSQCWALSDWMPEPAWLRQQRLKQRQLRPQRLRQRLPARLRPQRLKQKRQKSPTRGPR